jgi:hypothetical protein
MKRLLIIVLTAGLAASATAFDGQAGPLAPAAEAPPPNEFAGPSNAALVYYRAWLVADDTAWTRVNQEDDRAALPDLQPAIEQIITASSIRYCDWGVDYGAGPWALLPHLGKLRASARVLRADAEQLAAAGDVEGALVRLEALFRMSHQAQRDRMIISSLVGAAISNLACDTTEKIMGANHVSRAQARRLLAAAQLPGDPFAAVASVRAEGVVMIDWAKENLTGPNAGQQLASMAMGVDQVADDIQQMSGAQIARELDRVAAFYDAAVAAFEAADVPRLETLGEGVENGEFGALGTLFVPSLDRMRENVSQAVQRRHDIITDLDKAANR